MSDPKSNQLAFNFATLVRDLRSGGAQWSALPMHMEISTNARCNLRCIMCRPKNVDIDYDSARLDLDRVAAAIDELGPTIGLLTPSSGSEPFLGDSEFLAERCREHEIWLTVTTNGTLMTPERYAAMEDTLLYLQVSFDSHVPELYEWIRSGAKFDRVVSNLRQVIPRASAVGVDTCASAVLIEETLPHLPQYVDFVADLGFHRIELQKLYHRVDVRDIDPYRRHPPELIREQVGLAVDRAKKRGLSLILSADKRIHYMFGKHTSRRSDRRMADYAYYLMKRFPTFCFQAAHYVRVTPDGMVYPCCNHHESMVMGNIYEKSLIDIWQGPEYQQLRSEFFSGKPRPHCSTCPIMTGMAKAEFKPNSLKWMFKRGWSLMATDVARLRHYNGPCSSAVSEKTSETRL